MDFIVTFSIIYKKYFGYNSPIIYTYLPFLVPNSNNNLSFMSLFLSYST